MHPWLRLLHHDLVKRLLWAARDCQDLGQLPAPGELCPSLVDEAGNPTDARTLWQALKLHAPSHVDLAPFERSLEESLRGAERGDIATVLRLEPAFDKLRQDLETDPQKLASTLNNGDT